ncbi:MAG: CoB--CoM heterodisulfide reductase iron-sulfur subunit B family protein [Dehalococcoidia bacterium]|nr:CoB--CoM heterodisulfide reductase iron-sulfur subunit B family protein [Dehalococcoidia bacterium]
MEVSYYPGCSLEGTAREYGESAEAIARLLGVEFHELDDWNCCGASSAHATDDELATALSTRNLEIADKAGLDLVVPCAACFQRLKKAEKELRDGKALTVADPYRGDFNIKHLVDFLWESVDTKLIKEKLKTPLTGLNPVCYYGCLITRPPLVTDAANPEDPQSMDGLMKELGADVKNWSYKTDCCGGNLILTRPDIAKKLVQKLLDMALAAGADCIVAGCPMCLANLDMKQAEISRETGKDYQVPIFYFTELMGLAFGEPSVDKWFKGHTVDPRPLLREKGLL